jgi:hypothetical protein
MSVTNIVETSKTSCECGRGEFVFYACEADRWLYIENPREKWFEMHILCDTCSGLFQKYRLTVSSLNDKNLHWKLKIPVADQVPYHQKRESLACFVCS